MKIRILGIESSCDDTSAAVIEDGFILSNRIANQLVHKEYGGVVPELASRAHQQNIIPVVDSALKEAGIKPADLQAVAYTRGPGLMGALLVGSSFAKGVSLALSIPLIEINHLHAHILSLFVKRYDSTTSVPAFPFLCLLVSGGHTQFVVMKSPLDMEIIGQTIDDAAGEAFDKCAKLLGLPYPGGPHIDKLAAEGDQEVFAFAKPVVKDLDVSFSGLKTSFLYFLQDKVKINPLFIEENLNNLCASLQKSITDILVSKLVTASKLTGIKEIGLAGGVSANAGLRKAVQIKGDEMGWRVYFPEIRYTTDNAAMIAVAGYYKYLEGGFSGYDVVPVARAGQL